MYGRQACEKHILDKVTNFTYPISLLAIGVLSFTAVPREKQNYSIEDPLLPFLLI